MNRLIITLVIVGCSCFTGCGQKDFSLDGKVVQVFSCRSYPHTPADVAADAVHEAKLAVSELPAIVPAIERLEGGEGPDSIVRATDGFWCSMTLGPLATWRIGEC